MGNALSGNNKQHECFGLRKKKAPKRINILIPMAGEGSRFANVGYVKPKPLIEIDGKTMIKWVCENLDTAEFEPHYIFVIRRAHDEKYGIAAELKKQAKFVEIAYAEELTEGPACTCLLAKHFFNNDTPLFICNSDQFIEWDASSFFKKMTSTSNPVDGGIVTFFVPKEKNDTKWSYAATDKDGYVTDCQEKVVISEQATVGYYYFSNGAEFVKLAEQMIAADIRVKNEFYVCPVYNQGIANGAKYICYDCKKMWGLGVPDDVKTFLKDFLNWEPEKIDIWEENEKSA